MNERSGAPREWHSRGKPREPTTPIPSIPAELKAWNWLELGWLARSLSFLPQQWRMNCCGLWALAPLYRAEIDSIDFLNQFHHSACSSCWRMKEDERCGRVDFIKERIKEWRGLSLIGVAREEKWMYLMGRVARLRRSRAQSNSIQLLFSWRWKRKEKLNWSWLVFVDWLNIITVNKGLLFIKYVNAISITFRIIKRFNFIYRILVLLKYLFNFLPTTKPKSKAVKMNQSL